MYHCPTIEPAKATVLVGDPLTLLGLPARDTTRWTARRKAGIVAAVEASLITKDEACAWYGLSADELQEWQSAASRDGLPGLKVSNVRPSRDKAPAQPLELA